MQQQQAIQQQIQLQQLQIQHQIQIQPAQSQSQPFNISQQQHQQQVQNQLINNQLQQAQQGTILQQIVVQPQQQQTQMNQMTITTSNPNVQQHVNIQPKPPLLISQQATSQAQQIENHRPVMSMVSIGNTTMSSGPTLMAQSQPISSMCHLTTPLTSPPQVPLMPPPNPLVAMSTLSAGPYNNTNSVTVTPSLVHSNKEKTNEVAPNQISSEKNAENENVATVSSTPVSTATTTTTTATGSGDCKENEVTPMDTTPAEG